jgi:hypothetical protein
MKTLLVIITTLFYFTASASDTLSQSQKFSNKNSLQFELFGHGLLYSVNYERILINNSKFKTAVSAGASYLPPETGFIGLWLPITFSEIISFNKHHVEVGIGSVITRDRKLYKDVLFQKEKVWGAFGSFELGYRYQKPDGRFLFKAAFTPFIEFFNTDIRRLDAEIYPSGGLTFGYCF